MKKLSVILNVVLVIAVAVLYVLHFSGDKTASVNKEEAGLITNTPSGPAGKVVYINIDSVYAQYDMYEDVLNDLQEKLNTSEAQLQSKQKAFQKKYQDAQYKAERGLVTRAELAKIEQTLAVEQQDLMALQNKLQYQLAEEEAVAQRKVLNSIMEYLKEVENEKPYQFVLGSTTFGGNVLYANKNLDISKSVIEGLNIEYNKDKEGVSE